MTKTGRGRIPYSSLSNVGCVVQGLPAGLSFKQPSLYNTHELRSICNYLESIKFIVVDVNDTVTAGLYSNASLVPGIMHADVTSD